jgi:hypothetical protein
LSKPLKSPPGGAAKPAHSKIGHQNRNLIIYYRSHSSSIKRTQEIFDKTSPTAQTKANQAQSKKQSEEPCNHFVLSTETNQQAAIGQKTPCATRRRSRGAMLWKGIQKAVVAFCFREPKYSNIILMYHRFYVSLLVFQLQQEVIE